MYKISKTWLLIPRELKTSTKKTNKWVVISCCTKYVHYNKVLSVVKRKHSFRVCNFRSIHEHPERYLQTIYCKFALML